MNKENYAPLQPGIPKEVAQKVIYVEDQPQRDVQDVVYCYWKLYTKEPLSKHFTYTVLPDACIDIVFDTSGATEPIIMTPGMQVEAINLGTHFNYVGIRFKPGTFSKLVDARHIVGNQINLREIISERLYLPVTNLKNSPDATYTALLDVVVRNMLDAHSIERNRLIEQVVQGLQQGLSVEAIAEKSGYSTRQLRRNVARQTGYTPAQLRRILRLQAALSSGDPLLRFADQSHLIKEFKAVTGTSYRSFTASFMDAQL